MDNKLSRGSFTLPGEAGYEDLTLEMAERWGADVIRDSDGTVLSESIMNSGYSIYSTICIIRDHNKWIEKNPDRLQQCFLMTSPVVAKDASLTVPLMQDYFNEQFRINENPDSLLYWQVYNRTSNEEVPRENWYYEKETGSVVLKDITPWHRYTVNFLAWRIWEEISMYNHTTNNWNKEHLMPLEPFYEDVQIYLLNWLDSWCREHPKTRVVRFTSLFYNFAWIWGSRKENRYLFTDWASYDFTVSPAALNRFREIYGYSLTSENFINRGKFMVTHMPGNKAKKDWMEFINDFVIGFGKKLIDIVHSYDKLAYVFYDDSWVGIEPYGERFPEFGFDGIIKCVFSGYEARLCSGVPVATHEIRLHPYLFPIGLNGVPTFMEGGDPAKDARKYWIDIRRALLREPIDRMGLGGYLHMVKDFPDFCDYIEKITSEFRYIKTLHQNGSPYQFPIKAAVLTSWGKLRSWSLSGHFHETHMHDLIHVNEALSGLPFSVSFINFDDIKKGILEDFDVVINGGAAESAWSGGPSWEENEVVAALTRWVDNGGVFIGINEPSAVKGFDRYFRMSHVLGVDKDTGARVSHGKWSFEIAEEAGLLPAECFISPQENIYLTDGNAKVLKADGNIPTVTVNFFGGGMGIYLSSFTYSPENTRLLLNLLLYGKKYSLTGNYITGDPYTECAYYPDSHTMVLINNSNEKRLSVIPTEFGTVRKEIEPYDLVFLELNEEI